jgi:iron complex outermembrane receptor protein
MSLKNVILIHIQIKLLIFQYLSSMRKIYSNWIFYSIFVIVYLTLSTEAYAQDTIVSMPGDTLKKLSLEELMNVEIEVTSVSRRSEKLTEVASAIQVITQEDIRRSAATSLPEALRLSPNLQVAQLSANAWIISARGFNAPFSNKLLVMVDGRTVYSPLFAGVFWDAQSVLLEDVERIEIISGPGGTLWGANAVNGVINIITKNAKDTKGLYVSGAAGSFLKDHEAIRYGGKIGSDFSYRIYGQHTNRGYTYKTDGTPNSDKWGFLQGGFRTDWTISKKNTLMVQGNAYGGTEYTAPTKSTFDGQNVLGKWEHTFSSKSELIVQAYYDRTWRRDIPSTISDQLNTYDFDFQHRFSAGRRNSILWGGGYRLMEDLTLSSTVYAGFLPNKLNMNLFSAFIQDELTIAPDKLKFTIGTKIQHNAFTGIEFQPSGRIAWTPSHKYTIWGAVSRAVRMPSRIDVDYYVPTFPVPPTIPHVAGGPDFRSESVIAYELGYRYQPSSKLSLSLATFYNQYYDLYSVEALPGTAVYQIQNGTQGYSYGIEFSGIWQVMNKWKLRGGYTFFSKTLSNKPGHTYDFAPLGYDAQNMVLIQSIINLPGNLQFDVTGRYIDRLYGYTVPDYFSFDMRLAYEFKKVIELSLVGQNLWENRHIEYQFQIPRSIYGKITCRI